jgi:hypothetical protein
MQETLSTISLSVSNNEVLKVFAQRGLCRKWSAAALEFVRATNLPVCAEAREVEIVPGYKHTFVRAWDGCQPYLLDGTGTIYHEPYYGPEAEAPSHLQNSKPDKMINRYHQVDGEI